MRKTTEMHETMSRLYLAAKELKGVEGLTGLARLLNESPQLLNNWERRGISSAGMLKVAPIVGCRSEWLDDGQGDMAASATAQLTASQTGSEVLVSPDMLDKSNGVKNTLSPEIRGLFADVEAAAREGWLTSDVIKTLSKVLRLAAPSVKKPMRVHTEHHILAEGTEGQKDERGKSARR